MIFEERRILSQMLGNTCLLAALSGDGRLDLIYRSKLDSLPMVSGAGFTQDSARTVNGGARLSGTLPDAATAGDALDLIINGTPQRLATIPSEHDLFDGLNSAIIIRNGERAAVVADWLRYHAATQAVQGVVILDMAGPQPDHVFARRLRRTLAQHTPQGLVRVVVVSSNTPLGKPGTPAEAHPISAPDAPGKDRMTRPEPDPWSAPLGESIVFELLRCWFLNRARAVLSLEAHDLLRPMEGASVFDHALRSKAGMVPLIGERIYPWGLRHGKRATFGDHICRRFDGQPGNPRWCLDPARTGPEATWQHIRVGGVTSDGPALVYDRCIALRHPGQKISKLVPKASLVENKALITRAIEVFGVAPVRAPREETQTRKKDGRSVIVTTMKNEGPFILEWLAYHRAIGFDDVLIYTNDCTDGTDTMLDLLQRHGVVQHRQNPFRDTALKPQHAALQAAEAEPLVLAADWVTCMDVDEFVNIHVGDGHLRDLIGAVGDANLISMTWRLFGNADRHGFEDRLVIDQFTRCAPQLIRKPHQAWGFKTLFRNIGLFKKLGVHRPKGLKPQLVDQINWVNGSGAAMPPSMYRNAWRSSMSTFGYELVTLNHYAVRSAESFLVKRDRGRVNHVDRDQGMNYWFRMNNNAEQDRSIQRMIPAVRDEMAKLLALDGVAQAHSHAVTCHRAKIAELQARADYGAFYETLTSPRAETLSRLHHIFGRDTFSAGPEVIPDDVVRLDHPKGFFFRPSAHAPDAN